MEHSQRESHKDVSRALQFRLNDCFLAIHTFDIGVEGMDLRRQSTGRMCDH